MKILVTGSNGFIGKNLLSHLSQDKEHVLMEFNRDVSSDELVNRINNCDFIIHLAGVNRPENIDDFYKENAEFTEFIVNTAATLKNPPPILFTSSVHAAPQSDNVSDLIAMYGSSKLAAENIIQDYSNKTSSPVYIYRLPHIMGKWCKPNYNSVIATFCHNIANGLPITINNEETELNIVYIDDLVKSIIEAVGGYLKVKEIYTVEPCYKITLGELANTLLMFKENRNSLVIENIGIGFMRCLYATFLSYYPDDKFSYELIQYNDERGKFVEFMKTKEAGQFSYFTSEPGVTRGRHFHHTKCEKFLIVQGTARYKFVHIDSGEEVYIETCDQEMKVIETIPGWAHDITNIGNNNLIVLLWASEVFDRNNPDTYSFEM